jgi:predicted permease
VKYLRRFLSKCIGFIRNRHTDAELDREITAHLALLEDDFREKGMNVGQAHRAARLTYGNVEQVKQAHREERSILWIEQLLQDTRFTMRQFRKAPGFAITVILTIALGIGANTAIFTLIHSILMKSLPVTDPSSLYRIGNTYTGCCFTNGLDNDNGEFDIFSWENYQHLRASTPEFESLAAVQAGAGSMSVRRGGSPAQSKPSEFVSGNYFNTFGIAAFAGRVFTDNDDRVAAPPVAVMSYQSWQSDYGSDPSVIGGTFYLQSHPVTVVGIAPPDFYGDRITAKPPAFWVPLANEPLLAGANSILHLPIACWLYVLGRLQPGVAIGPLQQKISANLRQWMLTQDDYLAHGIPALIPRVHVVLSPAGAGIQFLQKQTDKDLYLLLSISALVLLVACANVANLMLARGIRRTTETSLRMALGSARFRLIRQMLIESVLLGCLGGLAGLVLAYGGTRIILALAFPDSLHSAIQATPSIPVLCFAFLLSLATGVVFGIGPAWMTSRTDPAEALRGAGRVTRERASLPQTLMIVLQAAFALVLLMAAGLFTRSLQRLEHQDFGLETTNRYVLHLNPLGAGYQPEKLSVLHQRLETQLAAIPGMQTVGLGMYSPLDGNQWTDGIYPAGRPMPGPTDDTDAMLDRVSPRFLDAVGERVIRGRGLNQSDNDQAPFVAVVNEAFVKKFYPHEDPIGRHFGIYEHNDVGAYEIVGVVANAKYSDPHEAIKAMFFEPLAQWQHNLKDPIFVNLETQTHYIAAVVMKYHGTQQNLEEEVRRSLIDIDPNLAVIDLRSMDTQLSGNFSKERLIARLAALFGLLALVLTSVGLYGITAYQTTQRTREIGLRIAFGADRAQVVSMVMRKTFLQFIFGVVSGIPIALIGARLIGNQLFLVKSYDPWSLSFSVFALAGAVAAAGFVPALRAASINPMRSLRDE